MKRFRLKENFIEQLDGKLFKPSYFEKSILKNPNTKLDLRREFWN